MSAAEDTEREHCDLALNALPLACAPYTFQIARLIERERAEVRAEHAALVKAIRAHLDVMQEWYNTPPYERDSASSMVVALLEDDAFRKALEGVP
jgi:hypothetical protein